MACTGIEPTNLVSSAPCSSSWWDSAPVWGTGGAGAWAHTKQDLVWLPPSTCCPHLLGRAQRVLDPLPEVWGGEPPKMRWGGSSGKGFVNQSLCIRKSIIFYCIFLRKLEFGEKKKITFPNKSFLALWRWCKMPLNIIKLGVPSEFH